MVYGAEQIEAGLDAEPALAWTVKAKTGELSVNGPDPTGKTFAELQKCGGFYSVNADTSKKADDGQRRSVMSKRCAEGRSLSLQDLHDVMLKALWNGFVRK